MQNNTELTTLKSIDIMSIDVITIPGARYSKNVSSVIRIHTNKLQGDGFSVRTITNVRNNNEWGGYEASTLNTVPMVWNCLPRAIGAALGWRSPMIVHVISQPIHYLRI